MADLIFAIQTALIACGCAAWLRRQIGVVLQENRLFARSVRDANRILVLDHGEVVEDGHHAELFKRPGGKYAHLYALQAG